MLIEVVSPSFFFLMGRGLGRGLGIGISEVLAGNIAEMLSGPTVDIVEMEDARLLLLEKVDICDGRPLVPRIARRMG